jgi:hypothetical protein
VGEDPAPVGEDHVGRLERRLVVDAVAGMATDLVIRLQRGDDARLVPGATRA